MSREEGRAVERRAPRDLTQHVGRAVERSAGREAVVDEHDVEPRAGEGRRDGHPRCAGADHGDVRLEPRAALDLLHLAGQAPEAGDLLREGLHRLAERRHARHQMVVIDALREEPVGEAQEVGLA